VTVGIQLKEEFENTPLERQMLALAGRRCIGNREASGRVNCSKFGGTLSSGKLPQILHPTFLVAKKDSTTKRMVGNYVKPNKRAKPQAGFLHSMETMVEQLTRKRIKSKMDLRSGFWQVALTPRAQELTSFTTPT